MKKWPTILLPVILAVAAYTSWQYAMADEGASDEIRIRKVLAKGQQAIMTKDLRATMECVSGDYRDPNGMTKETLRLHALRAMRTVQGYEIRLDAPLITQESEHRAIAETRVEVIAYVMDVPSEPLIFELVLEMAKEKERRWFVFPVTRWRVTSMSGLPIAGLQDF